MSRSRRKRWTRRDSVTSPASIAWQIWPAMLSWRPRTSTTKQPGPSSTSTSSLSRRRSRSARRRLMRSRWSWLRNSSPAARCWWRPTSMRHTSTPTSSSTPSSRTPGRSCASRLGRWRGCGWSATRDCGQESTAALCGDKAGSSSSSPLSSWSWSGQAAGRSSSRRCVGEATTCAGRRGGAVSPTRRPAA